MTQSNTPIVEYIRQHQELFHYMDFLQEVFMLVDRRTIEHVEPSEHGQFTAQYKGKIPNYAGELFLGPNNRFYALVSAQRTDDRTDELPVYDLVLTKTDIVLSTKEVEPLVTPQTQMTITRGDIANYTGDTPITTTVGRFIANAFLIVPLFGASVPYHNAELKPSQYEKFLGDAILSKTIDPEKAKRQGIDQYYFLLSRPELFSPNMTVKAMTTDPDIPKVRAQMVAERKERLAAGDPTAMSEIETTLVGMDKNRLKDDPAIHYLLGKDDFSNKRKKLLVTTGSIEKFGQPGQFTYVEKPLADGWSYNSTPVLINEARLGSQSRAIETAKGGEDAKYIGRVFSSLYITEPDCKTTRGVTEEVRADTFDDNFNRYIINEDGTTTILNHDTVSQYMNKHVVFRSPFYCTAEKGFCARCMSHTFEVLDQQALLTAVRNISAQFTTDSLKKQHVSGLKTFKVTDLNDFLV